MFNILTYFVFAIALYYTSTGLADQAYNQLYTIEELGATYRGEIAIYKALGVPLSLDAKVKFVKDGVHPDLESAISRFSRSIVDIHDRDVCSSKNLSDFYKLECKALEELGSYISAFKELSFKNRMPYEMPLKELNSRFGDLKVPGPLQDMSLIRDNDQRDRAILISPYFSRNEIRDNQLFIVVYNILASPAREVIAVPTSIQGNEAKLAGQKVNKAVAQDFIASKDLLDGISENTNWPTALQIIDSDKVMTDKQASSWKGFIDNIDEVSIYFSADKIVGSMLFYENLNSRLHGGTYIKIRANLIAKAGYPALVVNRHVSYITF